MADLDKAFSVLFLARSWEAPTAAKLFRCCNGSWFAWPTRRDFINKFADELIKRFDRIVLEDLRVAAMARGRLALSILDAGWSYLLNRLTHKAESAGRESVLLDPAYTSKTCSGCGVIFEHLGLSDRWVSCDCGVSPAGPFSSIWLPSGSWK